MTEEKLRVHLARALENQKAALKLFEGAMTDKQALKEQLAQVRREAGVLRQWLETCRGSIAMENHVSGPVKADWLRQIDEALASDAGKGLLTDSECQARVDAAVRATWEEAAKVAMECCIEGNDKGCLHGRDIAVALLARASGTDKSLTETQATLTESLVRAEGERVLEQVWRELKSALGPGKHQSLLNAAIDRARASGKDKGKLKAVDLAICVCSGAISHYRFEHEMRGGVLACTIPGCACGPGCIHEGFVDRASGKDGGGK